MNRQDAEADRKLSALLRESRPAPSLPPDFQQAVWRRLERSEASQTVPAGALLARLAEAFVRPRFALASLSVMLAFGLVAGAWQGQDRAKAVARARYVATVAPWHVQ